MRHTPRLVSIGHNLVFLALTLGALLNTLQSVGQRSTVIPIVLLALLYAGIGTYGWLQCQRIGHERLIYAYFAIQYVWLMVLAIVEMELTHKVASSAVFALPLVVQSAILRRKEGYAFVGLVYGGQVIAALLFIPPTGVLLPAIFYAVLLAVVMYYSALIEREEHARGVLDEANQKLTEYARQAEELAAAKERNRLAREIHDNLGHYLTAVNMQIEAALAVMESDRARTRHALERAQALTREGLSEIRRSIAALRAAPIEARPLHEAILALVKETEAAGLTMNYQIEGAIRPCSAQVELALYRITQEGLTNIRKHARARQVTLSLNYGDPGIIRLKLSDDGIGAEKTDGGFGLLGIRERVKLLGGELSVHTVPGQGFTLQVEIPG